MATTIGDTEIEPSRRLEAYPTTLGRAHIGPWMWSRLPEGATVANTLLSWPSRYQLLNDGVTDFTLQFRASRQYDTHTARFPGSEGPPNFDFSRMTALVAGSYHPSADRLSGILRLSNGADIFVMSVNHPADLRPDPSERVRVSTTPTSDGGRQPDPGEDIWALMSISEGQDGRAWGHLDYCEPRTPTLLLPDSGNALTQDYARSRLCRALIPRVALAVEPELKALLRATLKQVHAPETMPDLTQAREILPLLSAVWGLRSDFISSSRPVLPIPRLVRSAAEAEEYAAEVMVALGFGNVRVTPPGPDGGIDVVSDLAVAQVKMEALPTGGPAVQALHGVAAVEGKRALFFSLAGYTVQAVTWADRAGMACFKFEFDGSLIPCTDVAADLLMRGIQVIA